ncbi:MAG: hypothetical protein ACHQIM_10225, partial [Sphingobacteriales bacterium]
KIPDGMIKVEENVFVYFRITGWDFRIHFLYAGIGSIIKIKPKLNFSNAKSEIGHPKIPCNLGIGFPNCIEIELKISAMNLKCEWVFSTIIFIIPANL